MKPSQLTASFSALLKKQGLRHIRFHDLRHASAGVLIANRVPLIEVQHWLGHSTIRITADLYSHLDYEIKLRSASIMKERLFDNELPVRSFSAEATLLPPCMGMIRVTAMPPPPQPYTASWMAYLSPCS